MPSSEHLRVWVLLSILVLLVLHVFCRSLCFVPILHMCSLLLLLLAEVTDCLAAWLPGCLAASLRSSCLRSLV
jgi:hypothetical protein